MNDLEFSFEASPWEAFLMTKGMGDTISAVTMLSMLEGEEEQRLEELFAVSYDYADNYDGYKGLDGIFFAGDGEEQDVYLLGVDKPLEKTEYGQYLIELADRKL